jgi:bifunctional DNase/RNase
MFRKDKPEKPPGGKPPGKPPEECPPSTGVKKMGNKLVVSVESELPPASAVWRVDLGDDIKYSAVYTNLAYDLVAAAMAKLGVEFNKLIIGEQSDAQFSATMSSIQETLKAGNVAQ